MHERITEAVSVLTRDGTQLSGDINRPNGFTPRGTVIFVHGFCGNRQENGLFNALSDSAVTKGFNTVLYDWRGIGQSQGDFQSTTLSEHAEDFQEVAIWTRKHLPDGALYGVGFSLGAAIVGSALSNNTTLDRVAYLSPAARPNLSMWPRYNTEAIREELQEKGRIEKNGVLLGPSILNSLRETDLGPQAFTLNVPLLVCQATADTRINPSHTRKLMTERGDAPGFQYREFIGASHSFRPEDTYWQPLALTLTNFLEA